MTSGTLAKTLLRLKEYSEIINFAESASDLLALSNLRIEWERGVLTCYTNALFEAFKKMGWVVRGPDEKMQLNVSSEALEFLFKLLFDQATIAGRNQLIDGRYRIESLLAVGRTSFTFVASHIRLNQRYVLKFTRKSGSNTQSDYFSKLSEQSLPSILTYPVDLLTIDVPSLNGQPIPCDCLVTNYYDGVTLNQYFEQNDVLTPHIVMTFIASLTAGLEVVHRLGLAHNDFHAGNILVVRNSNYTDFRIIDLTPGEHGKLENQQQDLEDFKKHLYRLLLLIEKKQTNLSLRRHLGAELYSLCSGILNCKAPSAKLFQEWIGSKEPYKKWEERKSEYLSKEFPDKPNYLILRYEEFSTPRAAARFFVPYPPLQNSISQFAPVFLMGSRGSGKSSYLAAQAFFPEIESPCVNFRDSFGIYFACRQGEFKPYTEFGDMDQPKSVQRCKTILVLKIIRRTIELLTEGIDAQRVSIPYAVYSIANFIKSYIPATESSQFQSSPAPMLRELASIAVRAELKTKEEYLAGSSFSELRVHMDESDLQKFFLSVQSSFKELSKTKFVLLFDDAGTPNLSIEMQLALNDLVLCRSPLFCCKVSIEFYSYIFEGSGGKKLEMPHDYTRISISEVLILKTGRKEAPQKVLDHFREVIDRRLTEFGFRHHSIEEYLGRNAPGDIQKLISGLGKRSSVDSRPSTAANQNTYYHGWDMVTKLSDRTPRHLLQLIEAIFEESSIDSAYDAGRNGKARPIQQDKAIREFSANKLRTLGYVGGLIKLGNRNVGLGSYLMEFVAAFGAISRYFLQTTPPRPKKGGGLRLKEVIAIEVNSAPKLNSNSDAALRELVRYGVLDDSVLQLTRDDKTKKPIYVLNKIYTPALGISFRRQEDWRLSADKFRDFLLEPNSFARAHIGNREQFIEPMDTLLSAQPEFDF